MPRRASTGRVSFAPTDAQVRALTGDISAILEQNMKQAAAFVAGEVIFKLQVRQPVRLVYPRDGSAPYQVGLNPSKPGEPPHKISGKLVDSVTSQVVRTGGKIIGLVGTNTPYGRRLELGFFGTDESGRTFAQEPRPHLRVTVFENADKIRTIIAKGKL